tara:strand:- start:285 stop:743 length:459 start_codon:yes stop_codon:yes gene_type:complete
MVDMDFIIDVDGVLTSGKFFYSANGKVYKEFGPHDAYSLKQIQDKLNIHFISADLRGFEISKRRINDMGFHLTHVTEDDRYMFIKNNYDLNNLIYMGDGDSDAELLRESFKGIAPNNSRPLAKKSADYVTVSNGGDGAVAEACDWIMSNIDL